MRMPGPQRREKLGLPPGDEDPYLDEFSDDEWQEPEEPPELVAMRRKLAEYSARPGEVSPACASRGCPRGAEHAGGSSAGLLSALLPLPGRRSPWS